MKILSIGMLILVAATAATSLNANDVNNKRALLADKGIFPPDESTLPEAGISDDATDATDAGEKMDKESTSQTQTPTPVTPKVQSSKPGT